MNAGLLEMMCGLPSATQRAWMAMAIPGLWELPREAQRERLRAKLAEFDLDPLREKVAAGLVRESGLSRAVPARYAEYRPLVEDAVKLLLARLSLARLRELLVEQLVLAAGASAGERLVQLCLGLPTLWKLGQIIARKPGLDADLQVLLSRLENGIRQAEPALARQRVLDLLDPWSDDFEFEVAAEILAEGSVGVVVPFRWRSRPVTLLRGRPVTLLRGHRKDDVWHDAVAKMIKPVAAAFLPEEMKLLDGISEYFDANRDRYPVGETAFRETAREVKEALRQEIDLASEQHHLRQAGDFFRNRVAGCVPGVLPFSSVDMTAMTRLPGSKVTDAGPVPGLAAQLFRLLILEPLFDGEAATVFHGDPHAGNLFFAPERAVPGLTDNAAGATATDPAPPGKSPASWPGESNGMFRATISGGRLGLLDWSQAGTLTAADREALLQVAFGTLLDDPGRVEKAVGRLRTDRATHNVDLATVLPPAMSEARREAGSLLGRALTLVDALFRRGIPFPRDLLLLRKSLFTLDGVLLHLEPSFCQDTVFRQFLLELLVAELPTRWLGLITPWWDRPSRYRSNLSTLDLQAIIHRLSLEPLRWGLSLPAEVSGMSKRQPGPTDREGALPTAPSGREGAVVVFSKAPEADGTVPARGLGSGACRVTNSRAGQ